MWKSNNNNDNIIYASEELMELMKEVVEMNNE